MTESPQDRGSGDSGNSADSADSGERGDAARRRAGTSVTIFALAGIVLIGLASVLVVNLVTTPAPEGGASSGGGTPRAAQSTEAVSSDIKAIGDRPMMKDPDAGLQAVPCSLPPWQNNPEGARLFFTAATDCLNRTWEPFLRQYDLPFREPTLRFPDGQAFRTPCGNIRVDVTTAAYYCNDNLYVPFSGLQTDYYGDQPGIYLAVIAHEYGHHVQEVAGIMDAVWAHINAV